MPVPAVGASAEHLVRALETLGKEVEDLNRGRIEAYKARQLKEAEIASLKRRIQSLAENISDSRSLPDLRAVPH
jgi:hypothetical protein